LFLPWLPALRAQLRSLPGRRARPTPADLSFKQMIKRDTTDEGFYDRMIIGRVVVVRDPGQEGGRATAVVAVGAHPTGFVPLVARVRFYEPPPGTGSRTTSNTHPASGG
jgi:hypothetical protein